MNVDFENFSHIEISGKSIVAASNAINSEELRNTLLKKYELDSVSDSQYYPMHHFLALIQDIEQCEPTLLRSIGEHITIDVWFPPAIVRFGQVLKVADRIYYKYLHGYKADELGHYHCERKNDREYLMTVDTPYPCLLDEGKLSGLALNFKTNCKIDHADSLCRSNGDAHCNYLITMPETN